MSAKKAKTDAELLERATGQLLKAVKRRVVREQSRLAKAKLRAKGRREGLG